eukprot:Filipodium_phascolosomae@DN3781_c0_g1_i1.p1
MLEGKGAGTQVELSPDAPTTALAERRFESLRAWMHGTVPERDYEPLRSATDFDEYNYAVTSNLGIKSRREAARKWRYINDQLFSELSFKKFYSPIFWISWLFLVLALWSRIYIHSFGEWLFLTACRVPIFAFTPRILTIDIGYIPAAVSVGVEIGVIIAGPIMLLFVMGLFMLINWLCTLTLDGFPALGYRFVSYFGLGTVLNVLLILLVDTIVYQNFQTGDAFKLYHYFVRTEGEGNGVIGIILTIILFVILMVIAAFIYYNYLVELHMNGRLMDVYHRLTAEPHHLFIPYDMEISNRQVRWICNKARTWEGITGEARKLYYTEFKVEDSKDTKFEQKTVYISVYTVHKDQSRSLYRHFVRFPEGAICEVPPDVPLSAPNPHLLQQLLENADAVGMLKGGTKVMNEVKSVTSLMTIAVGEEVLEDQGKEASNTESPQPTGSPTDTLDPVVLVQAATIEPYAQSDAEQTPSPMSAPTHTPTPSRAFRSFADVLPRAKTDGTQNVGRRRRLWSKGPGRATSLADALRISTPKQEPRAASVYQPASSAFDVSRSGRLSRAFQEASPTTEYCDV